LNSSILELESLCVPVFVGEWVFFCELKCVLLNFLFRALTTSNFLLNVFHLSIFLASGLEEHFIDLAQLTVEDLTCDEWVSA
jgi:hypothetical protein